MKKLFAVLLSLTLIMTPVTSSQAGEGPSSSAFYMNQILGLGTAAVGSQAMFICTGQGDWGATTPSIWIFLAGSLVFIKSEMDGANAQKAFLEAKTEEIAALERQMQEGGDLQRGIIEVKLQEEKDKLEFVQKRKKWTQTVATINTTAMIVAIVEGILLNTYCSSCPFQNEECHGNGSQGSSLIVKLLVGAFTYKVGSSGGGDISTYGSMALALGLATDTINSTIKEVIGPVWMRAVTFGVAAGLAMGIVSGLSETEGKLQQNIAKLEAMLAQFNSQTHDPNGMGQGGETTTTPQNTYAITALPKPKAAAVQCFGSTGGGVSLSQGNCQNPLRLQRPQFGSNFGNMPNLVALGNAATDLGNMVSEGNMAGAEIAAANIANNAGRVAQLKENVLKQMNDARKAKGLNPLDLDGEINKRVAEISAQVNKGLSSNGKASLMASSGEKAKLDEKTPAVASAAPTGEIKNDKKEDAPIDLKIDEGMSEDEPAVDSTAQTAMNEGLENFETNESDINKSSDVSIFKQVSNRYLLNYSKFFEKKKIEEVPTTGAPVP